MRKNQGYRAAGMHARTNATGSKLMVKYGKNTVLLSALAAEELCKWLIAVFDFEARVKEVAMRDLSGLIHRIEDRTRMLDDLFNTPVLLSAAAAQATLDATVKVTVREQNRARIEAEKKRTAPKKKRRARGTSKHK